METPNNPAVTTPQGATPAPGGTPTPNQPGNPGNPPPPTTVETLFPDFIDKDGNIHDRPVRPELALHADPFASGEKPAGETPAPETPPTPAAPNAPQVFSLEDLKGKMVRVKVDGIEMDVPADQVVKSYQLESHLQVRMQEVATREKKLIEIQQEMLKGKATPPAEPDPNNPEPPAPGVQETDEFKALQKQLDATRAELAQITKDTAKVRYKNGLEKIAEEIKSDYGKDDFLQRVPEIEKSIRTQLKDPANPTPEEVARFDNADYFKRSYEKMLMKELLNGKPLGDPVPTPAPTPPAAPPGSPPPNFKRPAPVIVESGGGSPSSVQQQVNGWQVRYNQALQKATNSGKSEDWQEVIRLKSEPIPAS